MRAYYRLGHDARLYVDDCIAVMADLPPESVDAVVCDPPYGLEFMGKEWDAPKPSWDKRGQGAERGFVGKSRAPVPGFSAYVAGSPFQQWSEEWAREALRVLKPGGHILAFGGTRTFHRLTCGIEDAGFEVRDCLSWLYGQGFPKSLDVSKAIDKAAGAEREVVGKYQPPSGQAWNLAQADGGSDDHAPGTFTASGTRTLDVTAPATDAAREWQGWGTALKPAWEPCVVARKPLTGTVAANVQAHGTGALNIDGCRIPHGDDVNMDAVQRQQHADGSIAGAFGASELVGREIPTYKPGGRWPANVALDEAAAAMLDAQSGERKSPATYTRSADVAGNIYGPQIGAKPAGSEQPGYGDTGGASRFFYVAKASKRDRGEGNTHPTVKPTALMRWLVRLVTPPGGIVLDPFAGSGTTLIACRAEGVRCIGIEREQEYAAIIAARMAEAEPDKPTLFDAA